MRHGEGTHNVKDVLNFSFESSHKYPLQKMAGNKFWRALKN